DHPGVQSLDASAESLLEERSRLATPEQPDIDGHRQIIPGTLLDTGSAGAHSDTERHSGVVRGQFEHSLPGCECEIPHCRGYPRLRLKTRYMLGQLLRTHGAGAVEVISRECRIQSKAQRQRIPATREQKLQNIEMPILRSQCERITSALISGFE